jgi:hypothetical protein
MTTHLTRDDAARWVAGVLDEPQALELEAHARQCQACEEVLRAEARAEALLTALLRQIPAPAQREAEPGQHPVSAEREPQPGAPSAVEVPALKDEPEARVLRAEVVEDPSTPLGVRKPRDPRFSPGARATVILVPLALAASLVLLLSQVLSSTSSAAADAGGLEVSAPQYERGAQIPAEALTANEPFPL